MWCAFRQVCGRSRIRSKNRYKPERPSGSWSFFCFFFQAEDGIRDSSVTGVQTCALPILHRDLQNLIPPLMPPKGAKQQDGGGGGGGDSWRSSATLDTDMELTALSTHYTAQLAKGGWVRTDEGKTRPLALATWAVQDGGKEN